MTWAVVLMVIMCSILALRTCIAFIRFVLEALALYVVFVCAALLTAFLCVGSGHHGEFVRVVIIGLTGGQ